MAFPCILISLTPCVERLITLIVSTAMGTVLVPELARLQAQNNRRRSMSLCRRSFLVSLAAAAAAGVALFLLARPACALFGQPEAAPLLRLCLPLLLPMSWHHTANSVLQGLGRQNQALACALTGDVLQVGLALWLTGLLAMPMGGMLIGMAVGEAVSAVLQTGAVWRYTRRERFGKLKIDNPPCEGG